MSTAAVATPKSKAPKKPAAKKAPANHPKYSAMIASAIAALKERNGSSRQALVKYIMANFKVGSDQKAVNSRVKVGLKSGVKAGLLKQAKGTGASGSFKVAEKVKAAKKSPKKASAKKPVAKKAKKPKAAKKDGAPATPKAVKPKKAKSPKKAAAKKPKSPKVKKPKVAKKASPKKVAKKPAAKKVAKK